MDKNPLDFSLLFGSAVHDVKNSVGLLLNTLTEYVETRPPVSAAETDMVGVLNFEASKINIDLVQLLSLYRLQSERLFVTPEEIYLPDFIEEEILSIQPMFDSLGIKAEIVCASDLSWDFDEMLLKSVFRNVLLNTLRFSQSQIRLSAEVTQNQLCLSIEDDGPGYPQHLLADISDSSNRVDCVSGSTGLGLYFSAKVAELHSRGESRGSVSLQNNSVLGGGMFSICLP